MLPQTSHGKRMLFLYCKNFIKYLWIFDEWFCIIHFYDGKLVTPTWAQRRYDFRSQIFQLAELSCSEEVLVHWFVDDAF